MKVKEPQPAEYLMLRPGQILFTYLHLAASRTLTDGLLKSGVTGLAYETIEVNHRLPLLEPMGEIAGRMSVVVDIAIDQGGCIETSHAMTHHDPVFVEEGVTDYCVANMPAAYSRNATQALTNVTYRYIELLADLGLKDACERQPTLLGGINVMDGKVTCKAVADAHGLPSGKVW